MRLAEESPEGNVPASADHAQRSTRLDGSSVGPCNLNPCRYLNDSVPIAYSFRAAFDAARSSKKTRFCGQLTEQHHFHFHRHAYHLSAIILLRYIYRMNVNVVGTRGILSSSFERYAVS